MNAHGRATLLGVFVLLGALSSQAGVNAWTTNGPRGADIRALAIDPSAPATLYAGGSGIFKSTDGGGSWSTLHTGVYVQALAIDSSAPTTLYAGTLFAGVVKSTDGGESWRAINAGLTVIRVEAVVIDPSTPATLYAGCDTGVFKSTNAGESWTAVNTGLPRTNAMSLAIDPSAPATLYAGMLNGGAFKSTNGGQSWSAVNTGLTANGVYALAIDPSTPATVYAGSSEGVFKSTNGGQSWSAINAGLTRPSVQALAIDPSTPTTVYAGSFAGVFKSTNGGQSWTAINTGLTGDVVALAVDPSAGATLYAGTFVAGVFRSTNGGGRWSPINTGLPTPSIDAVAVDPSAPGTLYAGAGDGTTDSGGGDSGVFKSTDGGVNWSSPSSHMNGPRVLALAIDPSTATLYAGTFSWDYPNGVFKSTDGGVNWTWSLLNVSVFALAIDPSNPATLYAGTPHNGIAKSTNRGASWTFLRTQLNETSVKALAVDPSTSATIYAGTSNHTWTSGGVIKSYDGGEGWTAMNAGLANRPVLAVAIDPVTPTTLYAGTRGAGVFKTTNGGASWTVANTGLTNWNVRALAIDPTEPATLYAGTAGGGVFMSTNGGASWAAMNPGLTNLFVSALGIDPSKPARIYAGTNGGVYEYLRAAEPCVPGATILCLNGGRFGVSTEWSTRDGRGGTGQAVALTEDTGYFSFFDAANVEVLVKVLDGCGFNDRFWTFAGGLTDVHVVMTVFDSRTGDVKTYTNPQGTLFQPIQDTDAFATCSSGAARRVEKTTRSTAIDSASSDFSDVCVADSTTLCLNNARYKVQSHWFTRDGATGAGQVIPLTPDTGAFWFFSPSNVEMVVKVLNGCAFNSHYWTFAGGLTDVNVTLTVTDTQTGDVRTYINPQGTPFEPIQDTSAFATCP